MKVKISWIFNFQLEKSCNLRIIKKRGLNASATQGLRNYSIKIIYGN